MTANGDIYLGVLGSEYLLSPGGRRLAISDIEISRSDRTADGTLRTDIVATKMKFTLSYSVITGTALLQLLTIYRLHSDLSLLIYTSPTVTMLNEDGNPITVQMQPIERERLEMRDDGTWTGCTVELNEV
jgi:hypothetical protein